MVTTVLVGMMAWGLGGVFGGVKDSYVARVGSEIITDIHVEDAMEKAKHRIQDPSLVPYLRQMVIEDIVLSKVLKHEAKQMGLDLSDKIVAEYVAKSDAFRENGAFSKERLRIFLLNERFEEKEYLEKVRRSIIMEAISASLDLPKVSFSVLSDYKTTFLHQKRFADLFLINKVADSEPISDGELSDFYLSHKSLFLEESVMKVSYISSDDILKKYPVSVSETEVAREFQRSYYGKHTERRSVYLLSLGSKEDADRAIFLLKNRQKDFIEVASVFGKSKKDVLMEDVGYFDLSPELRDVVFGLAVNKVSEPVQVAQGKFVVAKTKEVLPDKLDPLEKKRILGEIKTSLVMQKRCESLTSHKDRIRDQVVAGAGIKDVANSLGVIAVSKKISNTDSHGFDRLLANPKAESGFVDIIDLQDCGFGVVGVDALKKSRTKELDEVRGDAIKMIKTEKQRDALLSLVGEFKDQLEKIDVNDIDLVSNLANGRRAKMIRGVEISRSTSSRAVGRDLFSALMSARVGEIVGPFSSADGGYTLAILRDIKNGQQSKVKQAEAETLSNQIWSEKQRDIYELYRAYLYKKYNVRFYGRRDE